MSRDTAVIDVLTARYAEIGLRELRGDRQMVVPRDVLTGVLRELRDEFAFDLLVDLTCVDYLQYRDAKDRFGLVYLLANSESAERITVRVFLNDPDLTVPSVVPLWPAANWLEREVWDMFGIRFDGHGDLRRILLPTEFSAHPLRKDYPLQGRGERHNFPVLRRADET